MSRAGPVLAAGIGLLVALAGVEGALTLLVAFPPDVATDPTLATLRAAAHLQGLADPTLQPDPTLGWSLRPGVHAGPSHTTVTIGPAGDRRTHANPRPHARHHLAAFGDSFMFGYEVDDDQTLPARLAARLGEDWTVSNHAVTGYGHDQAAGTLDRQLDRQLDRGRIDVALLSHVTDDAWRNAVPWSYGPKPWSTLDDGAWILHPQPVGSPDEVRARWTARPLLRHLPAIVDEALRVGATAHLRDLSVAILHAQVDRARAAGAVPILVRFPLDHEPEDDQVAARVCAATGIRCVDAAPVLAALTAQGIPPMTPSDHYAAASLDALSHPVADAVRAAIAERGSPDGLPSAASPAATAP